MDGIVAHLVVNPNPPWLPCTTRSAVDEAALSETVSRVRVLRVPCARHHTRRKEQCGSCVELCVLCGVGAVGWCGWGT